MPFTSNADLPDSVKDALPTDAQSIFRSAFNSASDSGNDEASAFAIAWTAVRNAGFHPGPSGGWVKKQLPNLRDQRAVAYRPAESLNESCANCESFLPHIYEGRCMKVAGLIRPDYTCDLFEEEDDLDPAADTQAPTETMFSLSKVDASRGLAFGWANIAVTKDGEEVVDAHDEVIPVNELEEAAYHFVLFFRDGGEMHMGDPKAQLVESVVFTAEKIEAMGLPDNSVAPGAWWIGLQINDAELKQKVASGELRAFSIQGAATFEEDNVDE